jgi:hypothetical protein
MAHLAPVTTFVFRPGGTQKDNVYTDWADLVAKINGVEGRKILEFDDSLSSPCMISPGNWSMTDVMWTGFGPRSGAPRAHVVIPDQNPPVVLFGLRMIGGQIALENRANAKSPISDFADGSNHVHIGTREDCGNPQIFNTGDAPLFDLGTPGSTPPGRKVFFFLQNTLFGIRLNRQGPAAKPLITHNGAECTINFIGQNQTGNHIMKPPAKALFGALSSSTQIGVENINGDGNDFGPVTRIQRLVQPRPPKMAAQSHAQPNNTDPPDGELGQITLPNVLLRCDGNGTNGSGFTVTLPKIAGGFRFSSQDPTFLYTGGQEIIVAEVAGGENLQVRAFPGDTTSPRDTIDGSPDPVHFEAHQARTFASDGLNNWITLVGD